MTLTLPFSDHDEVQIKRFKKICIIKKCAGCGEAIIHGLHPTKKIDEKFFHISCAKLKVISCSHKP